jgi:PAS domain S-box-containing protein
MSFFYTPYLWPLLIAALVAAWLAVSTWPRTYRPGVVAFVVLLWALSAWSLAYMLEIAGADVATKLLWAKVKYLGIVIVPVMWLIFAVNHFNQDKRIRPYGMMLLAIIPLVTLALVFTNEAHGLMWQEITLKPTAHFSALSSRHGTWFWVHTAYSYGLLLVGALLVMRMLLGQRAGPYRYQVMILIAALVLPWVGNFVMISGYLPNFPLDLTPFTFTLSVLILTWGINAFQLTDLAPVARDTIFNKLTDGLVVLDSHDVIVDANSAVERILSCPVARLIGHSVNDVFAKERAWLERYKGQRSAYDEFGTGEGENQRWYGIQISPFYDRRRFMGRIVQLRDITGRKKAELALCQSNLELDQRVAERTAALAASEEKFRLMAENANDIIWTTDMALKLTYLSPSTERLTGYTLAEFQTLSPEAMLTPATLAQVLAAFKEETGSYKPEPNPAQSRKIDLEFLRKDGRVLVLETQFSFLRDNLRQPIGILAVSRDSTERRAAEIQKARWNEELEQRVAARTAELEAANQELQALSSTIAHDLRSPLRAVVGYSQIAREQLSQASVGQPSCPQTLDLLQRIHAEGLRMGHMVDNFLDYLRLRHHPVERQMLDMNGLVRTMIQHTRKKHLDHHITYTIGNLPPALADEYLVKVVWDELLSNAIKFTRPHEDACIEIGAAMQNNQPCYFVRDTGVGFDMEHANKLFGVFQRLHHPDEFEGIGIGLAKAMRVVSRHGGRMWAEGAPGQGATFYFTLGDAA